MPRAALGGAALAILYSAAPLEGVMAWVPALGRARVAMRHVETLGLSLAAEEDGGGTLPGRRPTTPGGPQPERAWMPLERLDLSGVTHAYRQDWDPEGFTLGPVDLTLRPGELAFLTGGNGSGKTTLAKLLTGLYAPEAGEIRVNGHPVGPGEREDYRQLFSVVFADCYLFEGILGLGSPGLDERARGFLVRFGLADKVRVKDGVFSTTALSQGQRKRLALLTAYLEDRPVYVFDEWAADQDQSFRDMFYTRLLPELKDRGKAVLVITHDDRYFGVADRLVRLDDGRLARGVEVNDGFICA
jgi:putative ATP-binding cassette transporter